MLMFLPSNYLVAHEIDFKTVVGRVFVKKIESEPFSVREGMLDVGSSTSILTFIDGQCYLKISPDVEFRMREESILATHNNHAFNIRKGLVGCRSDEERLVIKTPHIEVEINSGIVVVKASSNLTRVALIKGSASVSDPRGSNVSILPGYEVAAGLGVLSEKYLISDELRFAWYWVEPEKEPSLQ